MQLRVSLVSQAMLYLVEEESAMFVLQGLICRVSLAQHAQVPVLRVQVLLFVTLVMLDMVSSQICALCAPLECT